MRILILIVLFVLHSSIVWNDVYGQVDHWETVLFPQDVCRYAKGSALIPEAWNALDFNDQSWTSAMGGVGYGDGDDGTVISPVISVYIRYRFNIKDLSLIEEAMLHADYDDGYVAYINGKEVARSLVTGSPPAYHIEADELHEASLYQGGIPEAITYNRDALDDFLKEGENVLAVQVHNYEGLSSSDLSSNFFFSVGLINESSSYREPPSWFQAPITRISSRLPIIKINTAGRSITNEPKVDGSIGIIWNGDGTENNSNHSFNEYAGNIAIEKRGQSSLSFPKNGYGFEFRDAEGEDMDTSFLNFPAEEDFILHGPYSDKTLLRNSLAMHLANQLGGYHSRTRHVELFINDQYEGVYLLMEKIKRDKNRVDIANLKKGDIEGDELTGGYVFKIDKGFPDWSSRFDIVNKTGSKIGFQYVTPNRNKIVAEQQAYIKSYVDSAELALSLGTYGGKGYEEYIDVPSYVDHFIIKELAKDVDAYRISSYYYKEKDSEGGKMHAGPVWDFNIAWGNANYCNGSQANGWMYSFNCDLGNPFWWNALMSKDDFRQRLSCRWIELREGPLHQDSITAYIDEQSAYLAPAAARNFERWPILDQYVWPNPNVLFSYPAEINYLKQFVRSRLIWMDQAISSTCLISTTDDVLTDIQVLNVFPNPAGDMINIQLELSDNTDVELSIFDVLGAVKSTKLYHNQPSGPFYKTLNSSSLLSGTYLLKVTTTAGESTVLFTK